MDPNRPSFGTNVLSHYNDCKNRFVSMRTLAVLPEAQHETINTLPKLPGRTCCGVDAVCCAAVTELII